jgi:hypothetical protein
MASGAGDLHAISTHSPSVLHTWLLVCAVARAAEVAEWGVDAMRRVAVIVGMLPGGLEIPVDRIT